MIFETRIGRHIISAKSVTTDLPNTIRYHYNRIHVVISLAMENQAFPGVNGDEQLSTRDAVREDVERHQISPYLWLHMKIESS